MTLTTSTLQMNLFQPIVDPPLEKNDPIEIRFELFNSWNPHVYDAIVELVREAKARGINRWSINGVFEVLRWRSHLHTSGDGWKLNNSYRALYARLVMRRNPNLAGFFEIRERKNEEEAA